MHQLIENYALVGDTESVALIGKDGSVDWMCLPRFDSDACFAALLGTPEHGRWLLGPADDAETTWAYRGDTFVLETTHTTATGSVRVVDYMPIGDGRADLVRTVEGLSGTVTMRHEWIVRFGYGRTKPWVTRRTDADGAQVLAAVAGPDMVVLRGDVLPRGHEGRHSHEFDVTEGQAWHYSMTWVPSHHDVPSALGYDERLRHTIDTFEGWASGITYDGPYVPAVRRSLLVLRALTDSRVGGIVAAPTTSLPETLGGVRNWDYRYCWLRDASHTIESLLLAGMSDEVEPWRRWLLRAVAGDPADLQIMYAVDGARELHERELEHLPGYEDSVPVRVGNGAADQKQMDVLGEVMIALEMARDAQVPEDAQSWALQRALVNDLADHWDAQDHGIWEIRGEVQHFTHSRVMVWVAFDRAIQAVEQHGLPGDVERWRSIRDEVHAEVLDRGFNTDKNSFTQHYATTEVDAALLWIPLVGFLPGDDPRVLGTINAIEHDLSRGRLVLRYRTESGVDGLEGDEHPFLACCFWLVSAHAEAGNLDHAHDLMRHLVGLGGDLGLMAEEYDVEAGRMMGNYPQAFSHLALVSAAMNLARADGDPSARHVLTAESADDAAEQN